jgi:lipopolysaccharide biosynthesis glycosyltransferase
MNSIGFRKPRRIVVFGFDDRIARQSVPALTSLSRHTSREVEVVILARRWRPWTKAYYRSLELDRLRILLLDMSAVSLSGGLRLLAHTTATMDRLYLRHLLPDADCVVYLDTDLICLADLEPLYELGLPDSGIAGKPSVQGGYATLLDLVKTWAHPKDRETILAGLLREGTPATIRTFNAGVLVMDLERLRSRSFVGATLDLVRRFRVNDSWPSISTPKASSHRSPPSGTSSSGRTPAMLLASSIGPDRRSRGTPAMCRSRTCGSRTLGSTTRSANGSSPSAAANR